MTALPILRGPLRYLIGLNIAPHSRPGEIVEAPYKTMGSGTHYCNLRDEEKTGRFQPYLPGDDISSRFGEYTPDPRGPGFLEMGVTFSPHGEYTSSDDIIAPID